jgi:hypothetical protein
MSVAYELTRCPACGGSETRELADAEAVREEMESLWAFHGRRLRPGTPPERLADRVAFSQRPPWRVVQCDECGTVYRNPRERAFELRETYATDAPGEDVMRSLLDTQRAAYAEQARRLTEVCEANGMRAGSGVEVGSYVGGFLGAARDAGWRFEGVDVNATVNAFARAQGFVVHDGTLDALAPIGARPDPHDAVAVWNCLDQLADPRETLAAARRLVRDGGVVAVRVPNGAFYATLRERLDGALGAVARGLLAHNNQLGFPYLQAFTVDGLSRLLADAGFTVARVVGDALVPIADEWTRGWAALEERALKRMLRVLAAADAGGAPWIEVYGVASAPAPDGAT